MKKITKPFSPLLIIFALFFSLSIAVIFNNKTYADVIIFDEEEATINAIKAVNPAVVRISVFEEKTDKDNDETNAKIFANSKIRSGSGFLVSNDGLIITNKHVIESSKESITDYQVTLNNEKKYFAQLIGKDPINDLAILKIFDKNLPYVKLGKSKNLNLGTSVIAIGNALGKYKNTATKGIVSGLDRALSTNNRNGEKESLLNIIQTDAEINIGNSGGPLINLKGEVVGINVATDSGGSSIGFAIPIDDAATIIKSVADTGRIIRPMLGIRFIMNNTEVALEKNLTREDGALIFSTKDTNDAIIKNSPADLAGLRENDIIFEINAIKVNKDNPLQTIIQRYKPNDRIGLKIQRGEQVLIKIIKLSEFK